MQLRVSIPKHFLGLVLLALLVACGSEDRIEPAAKRSGQHASRENSDSSERQSAYSSKEQPRNVALWGGSAVLELKAKQLFEDVEKTLIVRKPDGAVVLGPINFVGSIVIFDSPRRLWVIEHSSHYDIGRARSFDEQGESKESFEFRVGVVSVGASSDARFLWLLKEQYTAKGGYQLETYTATGKPITSVLIDKLPAELSIADFRYRVDYDRLERIPGV